MKIKLSVLASVALVSSMMLTGCGSNSSTDKEAISVTEDASYNVSGTVFDGPIYNAQIGAYNLENKLIADTLTDVNGHYEFNGLKEKVSYVKIIGGEALDLGIDEKLGGGDDFYFEDDLKTLVEFYKDKAVTNITPLTHLEAITTNSLGVNLNINIDSKLEIAKIVDIINGLEAFGYSSEDIYKSIALSIDSNSKFRIADTTQLKIDINKLTDLLLSINTDNAKYKTHIKKFINKINDSYNIIVEEIKKSEENIKTLKNTSVRSLRLITKASTRLLYQSVKLNKNISDDVLDIINMSNIHSLYQNMIYAESTEEMVLNLDKIIILITETIEKGTGTTLDLDLTEATETGVVNTSSSSTSSSSSIGGVLPSNSSSSVGYIPPYIPTYGSSSSETSSSSSEATTPSVKVTGQLSTIDVGGADTISIGLSNGDSIESVTSSEPNIVSIVNETSISPTLIGLIQGTSTITITTTMGATFSYDLTVSISSNDTGAVIVDNNTISLTSFSLSGKKATLYSDGTFPTITIPTATSTNYTSLTEELKNMYDLGLTVTNAVVLDTMTNKEVTIGMYLKNINTDSFVLLSVPTLLNIDDNGYMTFEVEAGGQSKMYSKFASDNKYYAVNADNQSQWIKTGQLSSSTKSFNIEMGSILSHFFDFVSLSDSTKQIISNITTRPDTYEMSLFFSDSMFVGEGAMNFTNDNEQINIFSNLDVVEDSSLGNNIKSSLGISSSTVKGFKGTINLSNQQSN